MVDICGYEFEPDTWLLQSYLNLFRYCEAIASLHQLGGNVDPQNPKGIGLWWARESMKAQKESGSSGLVDPRKLKRGWDLMGS